MSKYEKFYCILGLAWIITIVIFVIQTQFNFLNSEIETTQANLMQTRPRALSGVVITPQMARIIQCESGFNQRARGQNGEIGIAQFKPSTWVMFNEIRRTNLNIYNAQHQLDMLSWGLNNNKERHWTCNRFEK